MSYFQRLLLVGTTALLAAAVYVGGFFFTFLSYSVTEWTPPARFAFFAGTLFCAWLGAVGGAVIVSKMEEE